MAWAWEGTKRRPALWGWPRLAEIQRCTRAAGGTRVALLIAAGWPTYSDSWLCPGPGVRLCRMCACSSTRKDRSRGSHRRVEQVAPRPRYAHIPSVAAVATAGGDDEPTRVPEAGIVLRTLAGKEIPLTAWSQSTEGAVLTFGPLPVEADAAVLAMRVPPGLPLRAEATEEWGFPLSLRGEGGTAGGARLIETYYPEVPESEHHGIALRMLDVAHTADETVVRIGIVDYPALEASPPHISRTFPLPSLRDDADRFYRPQVPGRGL